MKKDIQSTMVQSIISSIHVMYIGSQTYDNHHHKSRQRIRNLMSQYPWSLLLISTLLFTYSSSSSQRFVEGVEASPKPFTLKQPDGSLTPELSIYGNLRRNFITDKEGYTVIEEESTGAVVYAKQDTTSGKLISSGIEVTNTTETIIKQLNITEKFVQPSEDVILEECGKICKDASEDDDNRFKVVIGGLTITFSGRRNERISDTDSFREKYTQLRGHGTKELMKKTRRYKKLIHQQIKDLEITYPLEELSADRVENSSLHTKYTTRLSNESELTIGNYSLPESNQSRRHLQSISLASGTLRNLVILMKFADQLDRDLPSVRNFNLLMNRVGGLADVAPTGSVRDVYRTSSYGQLDLLSTVVGWVTLPENEAYYADNSSGNTYRFEEALTFALDAINGVPGFSLSDFDKDGDGLIDSVVFIHSGYGAEWGAVDCHGQKSKDRIWSHQFKISPRWTGKDGIQAERYFTSSALWDSCGSDIARIGTLAHELGHVLGLPDLYQGGSGIGSFGLMGNSWGFDSSQLYPPLFSPWSKIMLQWVNPIIVDKSGRYTLKQAGSSPDIIKITRNFPEYEYLLIENRQPTGFDAQLPRGGLVIYKIDEYASFYKNPGFYGQEGWPENGNHYRVAVLQPDGRYDLEKGINRGDDGDIFGPGDSLGPADGNLGPFPNTDSYQKGKIFNTNIKIHSIVQSGEDISFTIEFPGESIVDSTSSTGIVQKELGTTYKGDSGSFGCMFDVKVGSNPLIIFSLDLHIRDRLSQDINVLVYTKKGSYRGFETDSDKWELISSTVVAPKGFYQRTSIDEKDFQPVTVASGETQAFYVTLDTPDLRYSRGTEEGSIYEKNEDVTIFEGSGISGQFGKSYAPRVFNGFVKYFVMEGSPPSTDADKIALEDYSLSTQFIGNNGNYGHMFDVFSKNGRISVTSFDIHIRPTIFTTVEIYSKDGSYEGYELDKEPWTLICSTEVLGQGLGNPTSIPSTAFDPVIIEGGNVRAFYITLKSNGDYRYTRNYGGTSTVSDGNIEIRGGAGITYPFGYGSNRIYSPRSFDGSIKYTAEVSSNVSGSSKQKELMTTYAGGNGSFGIMFDLTAKTHVNINNFALHVKNVASVHMQIFVKNGSFTGYEHDPNSWTELCESDLDGEGSFKRTFIPEDCFAPVYMEAGSTKAFYVTLSTLDLRYSIDENSIVGQTHDFNEDIEVSVGAGIGSFPLTTSSLVYPNRIFNGSIGYNVVSMESLNVNHLPTTLTGGNKSYGCIFTVQAKKPLKIISVDVHTLAKQLLTIEVWTSSGLNNPYPKSLDHWTLCAEVELLGKGEGIATSIDPNDFYSVNILPGETRHFYVTTNIPVLIYSNGSEIDEDYSVNSDLAIRTGVGVGQYPLSESVPIYSPRIFNGAVHYIVL